MSIAIFGTGSMARAIAHVLAETGLAAHIAGRDPAKAKALAQEIGGDLTAGDLASAASADILVLAVPYTAMPDLLHRCGPLNGKILVDISNPVTPDFMGLTVGFDRSAAEEVARLAPGAHVVKAFNTLFASVFHLPSDRRRGVQVLIAGDDAKATEGVEALVGAMGFAAVRAGGLANARFLEPVGEMNIHFGYALGWGTDIAPAWVRLVA